jgi:hypothetical protein
MWAEDEGVADGLEADEHESALTKKSRRGKRRPESENDEQGHTRKRMKTPTDPVNGEGRLLAAARRAKLSQQKARAMQEGVLVSLSS